MGFLAKEDIKKNWWYDHWPPKFRQAGRQVGFEGHSGRCGFWNTWGQGFNLIASSEGLYEAKIPVGDYLGLAAAVGWTWQIQFYKETIPTLPVFWQAV